MLNFELYNPVKLVFGKGEIEKLSTLIPKESKILVAYGGGSIFKNGIYDQVKKALEYSSAFFLLTCFLLLESEG